MTGFGLAVVKQEGTIVNIDTGKLVSADEAGLYKAGDSRWIELRYDPKLDDDSADSVRFAMQDHIMCNNLNHDDIYRVIANLANEFIKDEGY